MCIEEKIGFTFRDKAFLELACTHCSYANENRKGEHNERLEFLGDSILGLIVSHYLFEKLDKEREGTLSQLKASLVSATACTEYIYQLGLEEHLLLGKGERQNHGKGRESLLADFFEALIGAIYLDSGYASANAFFLRHFEKAMDQMIQDPIRNWKAELQDYTQKNLQIQPKYLLLREEGPEHVKSFVVGVALGEKTISEGSGLSKKEAEQAAAQNALSDLL